MTCAQLARRAIAVPVVALSLAVVIAWGGMRVAAAFAWGLAHPLGDGPGRGADG